MKGSQTAREEAVRDYLRAARAGVVASEVNIAPGPMNREFCIATMEDVPLSLKVFRNNSDTNPACQFHIGVCLLQRMGVQRTRAQATTS